MVLAGDRAGGVATLGPEDGRDCVGVWTGPMPGREAADEVLIRTESGVPLTSEEFDAPASPPPRGAPF